MNKMIRKSPPESHGGSTGWMDYHHVSLFQTDSKYPQMDQTTSTLLHRPFSIAFQHVRWRNNLWETPTEGPLFFAVSWSPTDMTRISWLGYTGHQNIENVLPGLKGLWSANSMHVLSFHPLERFAIVWCSFVQQDNTYVVYWYGQHH